MAMITLFFTAYLTGCLAAVPAGPIQLEVIKRALHGHTSTAMTVILTTALVDFCYGVIALYGIAPIFQNPIISASFWIIGGIILLITGIITTRKDTTKWQPKKKNAAITALALSTTNPAIIFWWLATAKLFSDMGLYHNLTPLAATTILLAGTTGMTTYLGIIMALIIKTHKFFSQKAVSRIHTGAGYFLICLGTYFIASSLNKF